MKRPNILVFMTDQQLGDTINSDHLAKTPNVERLKKQGVHFKNIYCTAPHCCPSRASFFTGLYPSEHNIWNNVEVGNALTRDFFDDIITFPEELSAAGYRTIFSGKWHVSGYEGPENRGFQEVLCEYISNNGRMRKQNAPYTKDWERIYSGKLKLDNEETQKQFGKIVRIGYPDYRHFGTMENPFGDTTTVELACQRIKSYKESEPFFMYVGTVGPHDPYTPPQEFIDLYDISEIKLPDNFYDTMENAPGIYRKTKGAFNLSEEEHKESIRRYLAFCSYEDSLFGKVLDTLEEEGKMEDTLVIYMTDHGDYVGAHGLYAKGLPCYREAYQLACVMGGADIINKGTVNEDLYSIVDLAPTILELAGVTSEVKKSGESMINYLYKKNQPPLHTEIFTQTNGNEIYGIQRAVWNKKWKLVHNTFDVDILYDLEKDPHEYHNVIDEEENQEVVHDLFKKIWQFAKDKKDTAISPYIMVALAPYGPGIIIEE